MLLDDSTTDGWSSRLWSTINLKNFDFLLPNFSYRAKSKHDHDAESFATFAIFAMWTVLYVCYKKLLNSMLRRMRLPFVPRNRIIDSLWCSAFSVCSVIFLTYSPTETSRVDCPWRGASHWQLSFFAHKTFYLHRATTLVFVHGHWLKGWNVGLLALDIFTPLKQRLPAALAALLKFEAIDGTLLNASSILVTLSRNKSIKRFAKMLFFFHFVDWIYIRILVVPASLTLLYVDANRNWNIQACLWIWLVGELVNSIRTKEFGCMYSNQCLESSLFPPSSGEAVEFVNTVKKRRKSLTKNDSADKERAHKQKAQLWQTICCAMTMKKKLKRISERKRLARNETIDVN